MKAIDAVPAQGDSARSTLTSNNSTDNNSSGFSDALLQLLRASRGSVDSTAEMSDAGLSTVAPSSAETNSNAVVLADLLKQSQVSQNGTAELTASLESLLAEPANAEEISAVLQQEQNTDTDPLSAGIPATSSDPAELLELMAGLLAPPTAQLLPDAPAELPSNSTAQPTQLAQFVERQIVTDNVGGVTGVQSRLPTAEALPLQQELLTTQSVTRTSSQSESLPISAAVSIAQSATVVADAPAALTKELRKLDSGTTNQITSPAVITGTPQPLSTTITTTAAESRTSEQPFVNTAVVSGSGDPDIIINHKSEKLAANAESVQSAITATKPNLSQSSAPATTDTFTTAVTDSPKTVLHQLTSLTDLSRPDAGILTTRATATGTPAATAGNPPADVSMAAVRNVQWMLDQGVSRATLQLHPAELGALKINLNVQDEQLSIQITATQNATREALETTLPRLREQLTQQGFLDVNIDLGKRGEDSHSGAGNSGSNDEATHHNSHADNHGNTNNANNSSPASQATDSPQTPAQQGSGLVDMFA